MEALQGQGLLATTGLEECLDARLAFQVHLVSPIVPT